MHFTKISLIAAALLSGFAFAGSSDLDDIPSQCSVVCAPIEEIASKCRHRNWGDRREVDCICRASGAQQHAQSCEQCVLPLDRDREEHDLTQVIRACQWKPQATPTSSSSVPPFTNWPKATGLGPLPGRRTS